jgi:hypothetical protein
MQGIVANLIFSGDELDRFPYNGCVSSVVYVGRDGRDVFMSQWNHYRNFTQAALTAFNTTPGAWC